MLITRPKPKPSVTRRAWTRKGAKVAVDTAAIKDVMSYLLIHGAVLKAQAVNDLYREADSLRAQLAEAKANFRPIGGTFYHRIDPQGILTETSVRVELIEDWTSNPRSKDPLWGTMEFPDTGLLIALKALS